MTAPRTRSEGIEPRLFTVRDALMRMAAECRVAGFAIIPASVHDNPAERAEPAVRWTAKPDAAQPFDDPVLRLGLDLQIRRVGREGGRALDGPSINRTEDALVLSYALAIPGGDVCGLLLHLDDQPYDLPDRVALCDATLSALAVPTGLSVRPLSHRELEVAQWLSEGKTSHEVGIILGLSEHTVNEYIRTAMKKLDSTNRLHFVAKSIRLGLVS